MPQAAPATLTTQPANASIVVPLRSFAYDGRPERPADGVAVDFHSPSHELRSADRAAMPPKQLEKFTGDAMAWWNFAIARWWWYSFVRAEEAGGEWNVVLRIDAARAALWCHTTLFLPDDASEALVRHEHGHRQLAERFHNSAAEPQARRVLRSMIGREFAGRGQTKQAAIKEALGAASDDFGAQLRLATGNRNRVAQEAFDHITRHGAVPEFQSEEGVRRAIDLAILRSRLSTAERDYRVLVLKKPALPFTVDFVYDPAPPAGTRP